MTRTAPGSRHGLKCPFGGGLPGRAIAARWFVRSLHDTNAGLVGKFKLVPMAILKSFLKRRIEAWTSLLS
jgi:hypothetical protein